MESMEKKAVAVIADCSHDHRFLQHQLASVSSQVLAFNDVSSFENTGEQVNAVVILHRRSTAAQYPKIPKKIGVNRMVVLSDCNNEQTVVKALESGAHHFILLNESDAIIQARLKASLRHHTLQAQRELCVEPFTFNLERRTVMLDGKVLNLSPKEYEFAYYLFSNRHRVVVNAELMTSVWSLPSSMDARRIDTAACRVRKKMELHRNETGWCLKRLRRVGYELQWQGEKRRDGAPGIAISTPEITAAQLGLSQNSALKNSVKSQAACSNKPDNKHHGSTIQTHKKQAASNDANRADTTRNVESA